MKAKQFTAKIMICALLCGVGVSALAVNHFAPANAAANHSNFGVRGNMGNNVIIRTAMPAPARYTTINRQQAKPVNLMANLNKIAKKARHLQPNPPAPVHYQAVNYPTFKATIYPGNLKFNLQQIALRYHWHLIWKLGHYNFHTFGKIHYQAALFSVLIHKVINNFPVRVELYTQNRVLVVLPNQR